MQNNLMTTSKTYNQQTHPFHILSYSKLPIFMATFIGGLAVSVIIKLQNITTIPYALFVGSIIMEPLFFFENNFNNALVLHESTSDFRILTFLIFILLTIWAWGRELINEATFQGYHTKKIQLGLSYGMILFLASEAMLFFPFFWAFFHASLSPSINVGNIWPPMGIAVHETLDPFVLPLFNTVILLTSGLSLVSAHRAIVLGYRPIVLNGLFLAIILGILFSWTQYFEYGVTEFTITDGIFGSTFFMLTGLHGFHVIVGTILLLITYWRCVHNHFSKEHHNLFEFAAWYWHFVDVVWLLVFICVYVWGAGFDIEAAAAVEHVVELPDPTGQLYKVMAEEKGDSAWDL